MEADFLPHEPHDAFVQPEANDTNDGENEELHCNALHSSPVEHPEQAQAVIHGETEQKGDRGHNDIRIKGRCNAADFVLPLKILF